MFPRALPIGFCSLLCFVVSGVFVFVVPVWFSVACMHVHAFVKFRTPRRYFSHVHMRVAVSVQICFGAFVGGRPAATAGGLPRRLLQSPPRRLSLTACLAHQRRARDATSEIRPVAFSVCNGRRRGLGLFRPTFRTPRKYLLVRRRLCRPSWDSLQIRSGEDACGTTQNLARRRRVI